MSDAPQRIRPLDVCAFDVVDGHVVAVDSVLPVVVVFDTEGELLATWGWPLDPELRGRPTAEDVCLTAMHIVVASPAAGGLIRIVRDTGAVELVPLEEDIGHLIPDGETIWAVADPNRDGAYEAFLASPDRRRVVWEEPSAEDMERFRSRMSGWFGRAPGSDEEWRPLVDASDPTPSAADWQRDDDDEAEHIGPTTPVWRIDGVRATRVDGALREVVLEVDLADFVPEATAPDNLDVGEFESTQLDHLRGAFSGGGQSETGERRPFSDGVDFDSVEIVGGFPHTQVVALFHAADRPGVQFGRRWRLYDDLGNPEPLEYADIHLMEEIEAAGYGLPAAAACVPDEDGVVWF